MSVLGFDLDGVIFKTPFYGILRMWNIDMFLYSIFGNISVVKQLFYKSTKINKKVVRLLNKMSIKNDILIISARPKRDLELVKKLLLDNKIFFTKIYLRPKGINSLKFKINKIQEAGVFLYFEDKKSIADKIKKICLVMLYKNGHFISI